MKKVAVIIMASLLGAATQVYAADGAASGGKTAKQSTPASQPKGSVSQAAAKGKAMSQNQHKPDKPGKSSKTTKSEKPASNH